MTEASRPDHARKQSLFARALDTPLRDLIRGRIKPRGDFHRVLAESDLEVELQLELAQRVQQVVWRRASHPNLC